MDFMNPTLAQALTASVAVGALALNLAVYRGGNLDRLAKASDLLAKLPTLPLDQAALMEARYCAFMRKQFSLRILKPLAFAVGWFVAGTFALLWGHTHGKTVNMLVTGVLMIVLALMNLSETLDRLKSPEAQVKSELARRENRLLHHFIGKEVQNPTTPEWASKFEQGFSNFANKHGRTMAAMLLGMMLIVFVALVWSYFL
ncbi:MAG TPA: hypothetical protein VHI93_07240 [Candidatus Thermoplasmatota archaeon]|nr:hypothetical protein [Candidatus Thermoplasmatota archaeon]